MTSGIFDKVVNPSVTVTPDTVQYTANDVLGNHASLNAILTFSFQSASGAGLINSLKVVDDDNEGAAGALWLFRSSPTAIADNAALALSFADLKNHIITLTLPSFATNNSLKIATLEDINKTFKVDTNEIFGYFVPSGTPTYAASKSVYFELGLLTQ